MVVTQIIHSRSESFHSRAHWQPIKSQNSLSRYKRSDMELESVGESSAAKIHWKTPVITGNKTSPVKNCLPSKTSRFFHPLRSKHRRWDPITAGWYGRALHPNCFDYQQYVPQRPDKHRGRRVGQIMNAFFNITSARNKLTPNRIFKSFPYFSH